MAALIESFARRRSAESGGTFGIDEWAGMFSFDNLWSMMSTSMTGEVENPDPSFQGLVYSAYLRNPIVFACLTLRARLFSEARIQFQQLRGGRPGNLFGTSALSVVEHPETGKTTGDLMAAAILDADLAGDGFVIGRPDGLYRLRPDWTTIVWGSKKRSTDLGSWDPEARVIGYGFHPGGVGAETDLKTYGPDEVCHFAPTRDPLMRNRGISLLAAGLREIMGDNAATGHKLKFFEHAATPNLAVKLPVGITKDKAKELIDVFEQEHRGSFNAFRTLFLGGGWETVPIGSTFQEMEFKDLQGKAETRIAALTGMHPVVVALSEGLSGSSLNAGNFQNAARLVGTATLSPLWRNWCGSLETIVAALPGTRLWTDTRDVPFLREDSKDRAEVMKSEATVIQTLANSGFEKPSVIDSVMADGDWSRLVDTGLNSVQLQPPLTGPQPAAAAAVAQLARTGYVAASPIDEAAIHAIAAGDGSRLAALGLSAISMRLPSAAIARVGTYRARVSFTPSAGPTDASARVTLGAYEDEPVEAGDLYPARHSLVRAFPSLFEVDEPKRLAGPGPIVSRADVLNARSSLAAAGASAGYESVARALGVSRDTVRRRLKQPATP
jgi:hypothetical protein